MSRIGFVRPAQVGEKRVALLPEHLPKCHAEVKIEFSYGAALGIPDADYAAAGAELASRQEVFQSCDYIYSLKVVGPSDYPLLRDRQTIIGWVHPETHGREFFETVAQEKQLAIVDLDNRSPSLFYKKKKVLLSSIRTGFLDLNSKNAGFASVSHAFIALGRLPRDANRAAVLAAGAVSQGALTYLHMMGIRADLYTRSNIDRFLEQIPAYDLIVSGIDSDKTVMSREDVARLPKGSLVVDAAANVGGAIEGIRFTSLESPIYEENGAYFYCVPNSPNLFFRSASVDLSKALSDSVYPQDPRAWFDLL